MVLGLSEWWCRWCHAEIACNGVAAGNVKVSGAHSPIFIRVTIATRRLVEEKRCYSRPIPMLIRRAAKHILPPLLSDTQNISDTQNTSEPALSEVIMESVLWLQTTPNWGREDVGDLRCCTVCSRK